MERCTIFLALGLFAAAVSGVALADDAYTWVDEEGIVHFSDRPQPGAERIPLPSSNQPVRRTTRTTTTTRRSAEPDDEIDDGPFEYTSLDIATPAAEQTLWNIEGVLSVSLALSPALQPGHQVRVYFNGEPRMVTNASFQIDEVYRGVHNIQAEVLDETGRMMIRSRANRFYVQQNTVF